MTIPQTPNLSTRYRTALTHDMYTDQTATTDWCHAKSSQYQFAAVLLMQVSVLRSNLPTVITQVSDTVCQFHRKH